MLATATGPSRIGAFKMLHPRGAQRSDGAPAESPVSESRTRWRVPMQFRTPICVTRHVGRWMGRTFRAA